MAWDWKTGMLAQCVADNWPLGGECDRLPAKGDVLRVIDTRILTAGTLCIGGQLAVDALFLKFETTPNTWFDSEHFRPLQEDRIASLRALLNPTPTHTQPIPEAA